MKASNQAKALFPAGLINGGIIIQRDGRANVR